MMQRMAVLMAVLAVSMCGPSAPQAQIRNSGPGTAPELPRGVGGGPAGAPETPQTTVRPLGLSPTIAVTSPPPTGEQRESTPDGGDSVCQCPDGQQLDLEGWCWRRVDPAEGYWNKAEKCAR